MNAEYQLRRAQPQDVDQMLGLIRQCLGECSPPYNAEYWHWKHISNPFGASPCLVAEADGQLIGLRAFMRWNWEHAGRQINAVRAVDTATHPAWRGQGVFKALTLRLVEEMRGEGVKFVFNTPNTTSGPGYLTMGWASLGRSAMWVKLSRPARIARALLNATRSASRREAMPGMTEFPTVNALVDCADFPKFVESLPESDPRLLVQRSFAYLRWRYADVPGIDYRAAFDFDRRDGAAVVFGITRNRTLLILRVCDLLIAPTHRSRTIARRLVSKVVAAAGCDSSVAMAAWRTPEASALLGAGFVPMPHIGPTMVVRPLDSTCLAVDLLRRSSWRLSIGALELF